VPSFHHPLETTTTTLPDAGLLVLVCNHLVRNHLVRNHLVCHYVVCNHLVRNHLVRNHLVRHYLVCNHRRRFVGPAIQERGNSI
jgi:hypothetical protein